MKPKTQKNFNINYKSIVKTCNILSVNINVINMKETVRLIVENIGLFKGKYICISNVHTTVMSYEDKVYRRIQNSGIMALPDGKPLSIVSRIRGHKEAERVTGPDLMGEIFNVSETMGYTHYFYGSTEQTLDELKMKLYERYPYLKIVGMYSPPFRKLSGDEDEEIIKIINESKADFLWVGLGAPKQEIWMYEHMDRIESLMIGVGAGFDYYANKIKRAPRWMQKMSLEWMYRLIQDPKRLYKRYFYYNIKFLWLIFLKK